MQNVDATLGGGRFAQDRIVSGAEPSTDYPRRPFSPWTNDPPEAPLGIDVNYVQPCGTEAEIERSLASLECAPSGRFPPDVNVGTIPSAAPPRPNPLRMRRMK
jgi:hypothetical protein